MKRKWEKISSDEEEVDIEINYSGFIPENYAKNEQDKILIYKKSLKFKPKKKVKNKIRAKRQLWPNTRRNKQSINVS